MLRKSFTIYLLSTLVSPSVFAVSNDIETVTLENATYCHVRSDGAPVEGYASYVGTFTEEGREFSFIGPGESGKVPLIKKNGRQYILVDHADAADEYTFDYTPEHKYILGYENPNTYCKHNNFPPCLILSKDNPCEPSSPTLLPS